MGDLIQIYKIINGVGEVDINMGIDVQGGYSGRRHYYQITREFAALIQT